MTPAFHPEALAELDAAAEFYQSRQNGLQLRYLKAVEDCVFRILDAPERFRKFDGEVRRALVSVFPYAVLFLVHGDHVIIIAVMHCGREPGYWKKRLA